LHTEGEAKLDGIFGAFFSSSIKIATPMRSSIDLDMMDGPCALELCRKGGAVTWLGFAFGSQVNAHGFTSDGVTAFFSIWSGEWALRRSRRAYDPCRR
jgi:hypothetical protein